MKAVRDLGCFIAHMSGVKWIKPEKDFFFFHPRSNIPSIMQRQRDKLYMFLVDVDDMGAVLQVSRLWWFVRSLRGRKGNIYNRHFMKVYRWNALAMGIKYVFGLSILKRNCQMHPFPSFYCKYKLIKIVLLYQNRVILQINQKQFPVVANLARPSFLHIYMSHNRLCRNIIHFSTHLAPSFLV